MFRPFMNLMNIEPKPASSTMCCALGEKKTLAIMYLHNFMSVLSFTCGEIETRNSNLPVPKWPRYLACTIETAICK